MSELKNADITTDVVSTSVYKDVVVFRMSGTIQYLPRRRHPPDALTTVQALQRVLFPGPPPSWRVCPP
jgi:hypothetical protein